MAPCVLLSSPDRRDEDPLGVAEVHAALCLALTGGISSTARPARDIGLLVGAAQLAGPLSGRTDRTTCELRLDAIHTVERYAALARALVPDDATRAGGGATCAVRQSRAADTHARAHLRRQDPTGSHVDARFQLHGDPHTHGLVATHAATAAALGLLDPRRLTATRLRGEALARAFLEDTGAPDALAAALRDAQRPISRAGLTAWGRRLLGPPGPREAGALAAALDAHSVRAEVGRHLIACGEGATPLIALERMGAGSGACAARRIVAFERVHRNMLLVLQRLARWVDLAGDAGLCVSPQRHAAGAGGAHTDDLALAHAADALPGAVDAFLDALGDDAERPPFAALVPALEDLCALCGSPDALVDAVLARHRAACRSAGRAGWFLTSPEASLHLRRGVAPGRADELTLAAELPAHTYGLDTLVELARCAAPR